MRQDLFLYGVGPGGSNLYFTKVFDADDYGPIDFICTTKQGREYFFHRVGKKHTPMWLLAVPVCTARSDFRKGLISFKEAMSYVNYAAIMLFDGSGYHSEIVHDSQDRNINGNCFVFDNDRWW